MNGAVPKAVFLYSVIARSRGGMYLPAVLYVFGGFGAESLSVLLLLLDADFVGSVDILFAERIPFPYSIQ